jgi:hypothetical protein
MTERLQVEFQYGDSHPERMDLALEEYQATIRTAHFFLRPSPEPSPYSRKGAKALSAG